MEQVKILIRQMKAEDVPVSQALLSQLGYQSEVEEIRRRYHAVVGAEDHTLLVAERAGRVIGLCHAYARPALDKPPEAIVQALVVDQASRGSGVGKIMMAAAEAWAMDRGFTSVALVSLTCHELTRMLSTRLLVINAPQHPACSERR